MRSFCFIFLLLAATYTAMAVKAYPRPVTVRQPDGSSLVLIIKGDEHFHYTMTTDGRTVVKGKDGYYYYAEYSPAGLTVSGTRASSASGAARLSIGAALRNAPDMSATARTFRSRNINRLSAAGGIRTLSPASPQTVRALIIPVQFKDLPFTKFPIAAGPREHFESMMNTPGYSDYGGTGSAKEYFEANIPSKQFEFTVTDPVTLDNEYSYYGQNDLSTPSVITYDIRLNEMVREACKKVDAYVDFSHFDNDGDGMADFIFLYFAGYNEAESGDDDAIWPQIHSLASEGISHDRIKIGTYACASELSGSNLGEGGSSVVYSGIGTFCHEFAHYLGLVDLYDTDYGNNGVSKCLWGKLSIMDEGNFNNSGRTPPYFCAIDRRLAGSANIMTIKAGDRVTLDPARIRGDVIYVPTENSGEYFLIENRDNSEWDAYIEGSGMVIYHIDSSSNLADGITASLRWATNLVNASSAHECADLIEAFEDAEDIRQVFFPGQAEVTEFTASGTPAFIAWDGAPVGLKLTDISLNGSSVTFNVQQDNSEILLTPLDCRVEAYQNRAVLKWKINRHGNYNWGIIWGGTAEGSPVYRDTARVSRYTFEDLTPRTEYYCRLYHIGESHNGDTVSLRFTTFPLSSPYPYIYLDRISYTTQDTLDLVINNLTEDLSSCLWFINDVRALSDRYVFRQPGEYTVKAVLEYASDGSEETIIRKLSVTDAKTEEPVNEEN